MRIDKDEEFVETVKSFCAENAIKLGSLSALGTACRLKVGLFNTKEKKYSAQDFVGDFEIVSLTENISTMNGETYIHSHILFSDENINAFGGHLNECVISAT